MDAAITFARNIVNTQYQNISPKALEVSKKDILDSLGTAIAGSTAPGGREAIALAKRWGGKEESTIIADGTKVPSIMAAWANGAMVHVLDYDDIHSEAILHAGASVVPAAFAVAEVLGKAPGKEVLTAITLGIDLECRMGFARQAPRAWLLTQTYGFFSAAAVAGRLLRFGEEKMINTLGIAYFQASGNCQAITDAGTVRGMTGGFAAKGGVLAAFMAQEGVTGSRDSLEGKFGFFKLYHAGQYDRAALLAGLGQRFGGINLSFKRFPCCSRNHAFIDAALELANQYNIRPGDVEAITIFAGKDAWDEVCEPVKIRQNPPTTTDAQLSAPFTVALAIAKRRVVLQDFSPEAIKDPLVVGLANKVTPCLDPQLSQKEAEPAIVEIKLLDGRTLRSRKEWAYGEIENPISWETLAEKFRDCCSHSVKPIPKKNVERVIDLVRNMEELDDVVPIIRLVS